MQAGDLIGIWMIQSFFMHDIATGERYRPWVSVPAAR